MAEWKNECQRRHYYDNKEVYKARARAGSLKFRQRNREFLVEYKEAHPCVDCGETDHRVLDFDHVRGEKIDHISAMALRCFSIKKLQEEIDKCDIRCANCHRIKTHIRRGVEQSGQLVRLIT